MKIFLYILLVFQLIVSGGAAFLGFKLNEQKKVIKERTQLLEKSVRSVATSLEANEDLESSLKQLAFNRIDRDEKGDRKNIKEVETKLQKLSVHGSQKIATLKEKEAKVIDLTGKLEDKEEELSVAKTTITTQETKINGLTADVEQAEAELAQAKNEVSDLKGQVASKNDEIDTLEGNLKDKEELVAQLEDDKTALEEENKRLFAKTPEGQTLAGNMAAKNLADIKGSVVAVDSDWNFVVLDLGQNIGLTANVEAVLHRADKLVGKVRISRVEEQSAIADVLSDMQVLPIQEGDQVFFK